MVLALPAAADSVADPESAAAVLKDLVRASLSADWRAEHTDDESLTALRDFTLSHLDALDGVDGDPGVPEAPLSEGGDAAAAGPSGAAAARSDGLSEVCAACAKLARNLCVGCPHVQEFWHRSDFVGRLLEHVCKDMARSRERPATWCEAVPTFLANSIAGHAELRAAACSTWFPYKLAAACTLCWRRPEHALMLVQNLVGASDTLPGGAGLPPFARQLLDTADGHCIIYVLLSLLCSHGSGGAEEPGAASDRAWEWASIVFYNLWVGGGFEPCYRGVKRITAPALHEFLFSAVSGRPPSAEEAPPLGVGRLVERMCGHAEALGLLWHSIQGLLGGGGSEDAPQLIRRLFGDPRFVILAAEEMAGMVSRVTAEWEVDWCPEQPPEEAVRALGVADAGDLDALTLANKAIMAGTLKGGGRASSSRVLSEICGAAVALTAAAPSHSIQVPPLLAGTYLVANVACLAALHRLRFGDLGRGEVKKKPTKAAHEASEACSLLAQLRLCGNVVYGSHAAKEFLRLTGGLRVLLCHCYCDAELPMLRENGILALRNATEGNEANQVAARALLAESRVVSGASDAPPTGDDLGLPCLSE